MWEAGGHLALGEGPIRTQPVPTAPFPCAEGGCDISGYQNETGGSFSRILLRAVHFINGEREVQGEEGAYLARATQLAAVQSQHHLLT